MRQPLTIIKGHPLLTALMPFEAVHITDIKPGDTIYYRDHARTVCRKDIKTTPNLGRMLFGDSFNLGHNLVLSLPIEKRRVLLCRNLR